MELKFSSDLDSAKRLDEIMNSYSGRDCGSILADEHSLAVTLFLLEYGKITVTEHIYPYDSDIQSDSEMMEVYSELARETRWKQFAHTEIERIRINALRQMRQEGKPAYDGEFMCWREGRVFAHCGNLDLPQLLLLGKMDIGHLLHLQIKARTRAPCLRRSGSDRFWYSYSYDGDAGSSSCWGNEGRTTLAADTCRNFLRMDSR